MAAIDVDDWLVEEQGSEVIKRLDESSVAETWLRSTPMRGETKTEPRMANMSVAVVAKSGTYSEDASVNDEITLTARKFGSALRIAEEDIDDNIVNVLDAKKTSWATTFAILFDNAVFGVSAAENGTTIPFTSIYRALNTTNSATGYTADANIVTVESGDFDGTTADLGYDKISDTMSKVEGSGYADSRNGFVAHPVFKGLIRKLKDADGRPIFEPAPRQGSPDTLFGYPIRWSNGAVVAATALATQAANIAGAGVHGTAGNPLLFFGNPDFAIVGKRSGPESVVIDGKDGLAALTDESILKVRARRAFAVAHEKAWACLEIIANT